MACNAWGRTYPRHLYLKHKHCLRCGAINARRLKEKA